MFSTWVKNSSSLFLVLAAVIALSACAARYPEAIRGDESPLIAYQTVFNSSDSETGVGSKARWGGVIAKVINKESMSIIEVVNMELRSSGRPVVDENSLGRFRVHVNGFIDPDVYAPGRLFTAYGTYTGKETDKIGEFLYSFPVLMGQGFHLWKVEEQTQRVDVMFNYGFGHPYYRYPYYGPGYYRGPVMKSEGTTPSKPSTQQGDSRGGNSSQLSLQK